MFPPERIVCLTEETVETLYLLGEDRRIVGVSGYAVRPPRVRREKPRVSAFITADVPKILALEARPGADVLRSAGRHRRRTDPQDVAVHAFNQRDVAGIFAMIRTLGALVGAADKAEALASSLAARVDAVTNAHCISPRRPRVYFEEWDEPMISGIGWVSELIETAGGIDVFPQLAARKNAKERIVTPTRSSPRSPTSSSAPGAARNSCRQRWRRGRASPKFPRSRRLAARDQIGADPAAGPGGADRRPRCAGCASSPNGRKAARRPG